MVTSETIVTTPTSHIQYMHGFVSPSAIYFSSTEAVLQVLLSGGFNSGRTSEAHQISPVRPRDGPGGKNIHVQGNARYHPVFDLLIFI